MNKRSTRRCRLAQISNQSAQTMKPSTSQAKAPSESDDGVVYPRRRRRRKVSTDRTTCSEYDPHIMKDSKISNNAYVILNRINLPTSGSSNAKASRKQLERKSNEHDQQDENCISTKVHHAHRCTSAPERRSSRRKQKHQKNTPAEPTTGNSSSDQLHPDSPSTADSVMSDSGTKSSKDPASVTKSCNDVSLDRISPEQRSHSLADDCRGSQNSNNDHIGNGVAAFSNSAESAISDQSSIDERATNAAECSSEELAASSDKVITPKDSNKVVHKAIKTSSFYSKKTRKPPQLSDWLKTANPKNKGLTNKNSLKRNAELQHMHATKLETKSIKKGMVEETVQSSMKFANMNTPVGTATRKMFKKADSSTPCAPKQQEEEPEYLFGFENLLEPAATLLDEVSPIPRPKLPKVIVDKKKKAEDNKPQPWDALLQSPLKERPNRERKAKKAKTHHEDPMDEDEFDLFQVTPFETEPAYKPPDVFSYEKEQKSPPRQKKDKPALPHARFDFENALPWQEILDHELVIETA